MFRSLVTALVLPHLDYCNSVLYGLPTSLIRRLQSVQNAPSRLKIGLRRFEHISPALIGCVSLSASPSNWQFYHIEPFTALDRVTSSPASLVSQTCRHDDDCACTCRSQLPAPRYGTTCRLTSQLRRHGHSRSSDSALRHFCSRDHTLTLSLNL